MIPLGPHLQYREDAHAPGVRRMTHDPIIQTDQDAVERFVDRLMTLDASDWIAAKDVGAHTAEWEMAAALVDALIAHHGLGVQAWDATDDVETAAFCSLGPRGAAISRRVAAELRTARRGAAVAAIALLIRPLLTVADFDVLYGPFAALDATSSGEHSAHQRR